MNSTDKFKPIRIERRTRETVFAISMGPRVDAGNLVSLPNPLLGHFLDHFLKASGLSLEIADMSWPGSWKFDHVLCEDIGQLIGCGVAEIHDQLSASQGVAGRADATVCMDESLVECAVSFEGRPLSNWIVPAGESIDGFIDSWYDEAGAMSGWASGTNLRQFFDGFAIGGRCTVSMEIRKAGNLHHVFEAAFRALGDSVGAALGIGSADARTEGDTSGFAGKAEYTVNRLEQS